VRPLFHPHLNVWDAVQVQGAQDIENEAALVILRKTWGVDSGPDLVNNPPKRSLEGCGRCGCRDSRDWYQAPDTCKPSLPVLLFPQAIHSQGSRNWKGKLCSPAGKLPVETRGRCSQASGGLLWPKGQARTKGQTRERFGVEDRVETVTP
jgi:hypothetical protein